MSAPDLVNRNERCDVKVNTLDYLFYSFFIFDFMYVIVIKRFYIITMLLFYYLISSLFVYYFLNCSI